MIRAGAMLLRHIGREESAGRLEMALDICGNLERKLVMTGRKTGASAGDYVVYLMDTLQDGQLEQRWKEFQKNA